MVAERESLVPKLQELEREYTRIARNPPDRPLNALGRFLVWLGKRKPPFQRGDDVWTSMEENTRAFVEEMSERH